MTAETLARKPERLGLYGSLDVASQLGYNIHQRERKVYLF